MLRVQSPLSAESEALVTQVIGCCIEVHRTLGPGLLEVVYTRAMCVELAASEVPYESEVAIPVMYRDQLLSHQRLDLVVAGQIVLELKAVERLAPVHQAQLLSYLRLSRLRIGLLVNFNVPVLHEGLKRIIL
jgi:GxxExxY protein